MLTKTVVPKTKADLIRALQAAPFRSVEVFEGDLLTNLPSINAMRRSGMTVIVIS